MSAGMQSSLPSKKNKPSTVRKPRKVKSDTSKSRKTTKNIPVPQEEPRTCSLPVPYWLLKENGKGSVAYFVFGRFQPGHVGHKVVFEGLKKAAKENNTSDLPWLDNNGKAASNVFVFVSRTQNKRACSRQEVTKVRACENPLGSGKKVELLEKQNPDPVGHSEPRMHFIEMGNPNTAIKMLLDCYNEVVMYVGSDRVAAFQWLKNVYPNKVQIRSAGEERSDDSENVAGMSSSKIRRAAVELEKFDSTDDNYALVKKNLGVGMELTNDVIEEIKRAYSKAGGKKARRKTQRRHKKSAKSRTKRKRKARNKTRKKKMRR
jgi:hypothetical protein